MGSYLSVEIKTTSDYIQLGIIAVLLAIITYLLKQIFSAPKPIVIKPRPVRPPLQKKGWTKAELAEYSGKDPEKEILMCVKGTVYDVTRGRAFYGPGGPYGIFAGRDASRALARSSFEEADLANPTLEGLSPSEIETLNEWAATYESKYPNVGWMVDENSQTSAKKDPSAAQ